MLLFNENGSTLRFGTSHVDFDVKLGTLSDGFEFTIPFFFFLF